MFAGYHTRIFWKTQSCDLWLKMAAITDNDSNVDEQWDEPSLPIKRTDTEWRVTSTTFFDGILYFWFYRDVVMSISDQNIMSALCSFNLANEVGDEVGIVVSPPPLPPSANLKMFDFPAIPSLDWLIGRAATAMGLGLGKVVVESWHFLQESEVAYLVTQYDISNCPGPLAKAALYTISTHLTYLPEYLPGVSELTTCNFYYL